MAIDTAPRRMAMLDFGSISTDTLPIPDGTIGSEDWWHLLDLYNGFASSPITIPLTPDTYALVDPTADEYAIVDQNADTYTIVDPTADTYTL